MAKNATNEDSDLSIPIGTINTKIFEMCGLKVMLDSDLAELYGLPTKRLNEQVKRNLARFPDDFMFRLSRSEFANLKSRIATSSSRGYGGRRTLPFVFTEQGVAMLSGVLHSDRAIEVNIEIMRAFVNMRRMIAVNDDIQKKLAKMESELGEHNEHFKRVFAALRLLMEPEKGGQQRIGYIKKSNN